jgi:hypothetical protein
MKFLDKDEKIVADRGYKGQKDRVIIKTEGSELQQRSSTIFLARHETVNSLLKNWFCLSGKFRHCRKLHGDCFFAVVVVTQLSLNEGVLQLFAIEPKYLFAFPTRR